MTGNEKKIIAHLHKHPDNVIVVAPGEHYSVHRLKSIRQATANRIIGFLNMIELPAYKHPRNLPIGASIYVLPENIDKF